MSSFVTKSDEHSWFLIANPISGNGSFSKNWKLIEQLLQSKNISYTYAFTRFSKHEIELVQTAIQQGYRNVIVVGGDGTLHHVVNGIMQQRYVKSSDITIGVIPLGTGNDWIKTHNIPKNIKKAIDIIHNNKTNLQDIGLVKTADKNTHYYCNVAGLGYDGYIVNKLHSLKRFGSIAYLLAGIYGLFFYKKTNFTINFDSITISTKCLMVISGICKFSGGGMQLTRNVNTNDGLLDITIAKNLTFLDLIFNIKRLYSGSILNHKKIETYKTKEIKIIPSNSNTYIQADGELLATGTATFGIIKKALHFVIS